MQALLANSGFRWFGSLKLGVLVLSVLAVVLIVATVYESRTSTQEVQRLVYQSWWFIALLGLLGVNVFSAAMARYPWKKHQTGFVLTHLGIIVLLLGSIIGLLFGVEGSVTLVEGGPPQQFFSQDYEVINLTQVGTDQYVTAPLKSGGDDGQSMAGRKLRTRPLPIEAQLMAYHAHTREELVVEPGGEARNPAVQFQFSARMGGTNQPAMEVTEWLLAGDPAHRALRLGPATVRLEAVASPEALHQRLQPPSKAAASGKGVLELTINEQALVIPVEENLGRVFRPPAGHISVQLKEYFADFRMDEQNRRPISVSDQPNNPAVMFEASLAQGKIIGFAFAQYPDMSLLRHDGTTNPPVSALYRFEPEGATAMNTLILLAGPGDQLHYVATGRAEHQTGTVAIGQPVPLNWMAGSSFVVQNFIGSPKVSHRPVPAAAESADMGVSPAVALQMRQGGESREVLARWGEPQRFNLAGTIYEVLYGYAMKPLGFTIELKKFIAPKYEGTAMPASFESYVKVQDPKTGDAVEKRIWMNHPLTYRGFRISQASYEEGRGGAPNRSILQVLRDPGYPLKGAGSILIVLGIVLMFFLPNRLGFGSASDHKQNA